MYPEQIDAWNPQSAGFTVNIMFQFWNVKLLNSTQTTVSFMVTLLSHRDPCVFRQGWNLLLRRRKPKLPWTHGIMATWVLWPVRKRSPTTGLCGTWPCLSFGWSDELVWTWWRGTLVVNLWESYPECSSWVQNIQVPSPLRIVWPFQKRKANYPPPERDGHC